MSSAKISLRSYNVQSTLPVQLTLAAITRASHQVHTQFRTENVWYSDYRAEHCGSEPTNVIMFDRSYLLQSNNHDVEVEVKRKFISTSNHNCNIYWKKEDGLIWVLHFPKTVCAQNLLLLIDTIWTIPGLLSTIYSSWTFFQHTYYFTSYTVLFHFIVYSCKRVKIYKPTTWCHFWVWSFSKFLHHVVSRIFSLPLLSLAHSLEI